MQPQPSWSRSGVWILGALAPAIVIAIIAVAALNPSQVRAEADSASDEVVCDGLGGLTMSVNTMTLKKAGTLTKASHSTDRECIMTLTLVDVSDEDYPADRAKSCTVTATPEAEGPIIEVDPSDSGDCDTVDYHVDLAFAGDGSEWMSRTGTEEEQSNPTDVSGGLVGASGVPCRYSAITDYPHRSGGDVSVHGRWYTVSWTDCPARATVKLWLKSFRCLPEGSSNCFWQTVKFKSAKIKPYNLSSNQVTARRTCRSYQWTAFQPTVQVIPGGGIRSKRVVGAYRNLSCRVW